MIRWVIILSFCALRFALCNIVEAQDLRQPITIKVENRPLKEVLNQISATSGVHFSYSTQLIDPEQKVTYETEDTPVRQVLIEVLGPLGIEYVNVEEHLVLRPSHPDLPLISRETPMKQKFTLSGHVRSQVDGEALIGANIYVPGTQYGAITNAYGFYSLTLPQGDHLVVYSFIGFDGDTITLDLRKDVRYSASLEEVSMGITEVIIRASDKGAVPGIDQLGDFRMTGRTLSKLPGFAGEVDVIKALQVLPGVNSFGDGSSFFFVRGGNFDQNLMMIDEAPIYDPAHLFGFFSVISPDAINEMKIYKGDFPSRYGGRASSVIDITAREGNSKRFGFGGNIGIYASSLTFEGPFKKEKASFIISGRMSNIGWLGRLASGDNSLKINFYDLNTKFNVQVSKKDRLYLTVYMGQDQFKRKQGLGVSSFGISWDNIASTLRWNHVFNHKLFMNTTLNYSNYRYFLYLSSDEQEYWQSTIANTSLKSDLSWYINSKNTIRAGFSMSQYRVNPGNIHLRTPEDEQYLRQVPQYKSMEYVFYASNEQRIGKHWSLNYGIRLPIWVDYGPTSVYYFDVNHNVIDVLEVESNNYYASFVVPEPRFSFGYTFRKGSSLKAGYSRMGQFLRVMSNGTGPFSSLDVWTVAGPNIEPLIAQQLSAGYFLDWAEMKWELSLETYYKVYENHMDYADHANLLYNPLIEGELRFGDAWTYGVEFMLRKAKGRFNGWLGYTWSRTFAQVPEVNGGEVYPAYWDVPHNLAFFMAYETKKRWSFSANFIYRTGNPYTTPIGFYDYDGYTTPIYGERNNDRLPDYHRLDLSVAYRLNKTDNRYKHNLSLTLYNAYGRANPFSISFNKYEESDGKFLIPSDQSGNYELVPTMISVAGVIPSINYQFKF